MSQPPQISLQSWLGLVAPTLALVGLIAYSLVRLGYSIFYGPLDVSPDEVGLGYGQSLAEAGVGLFLLALILGVVATIFALLIRLVARQSNLPVALSWRWFLGALAILVLASMINSTVLHAAMRADAVQHGEQVKPVRTLFLIPAIPISAEPVTIDWIVSPAPTVPVSLTCVLYLGQAGGIAVFYDPRDHVTLRLPMNAISITSRNDNSCPTH